MRDVIRNLRLVRMYSECIPAMSPILDASVRIAPNDYPHRAEIWRFQCILGVEVTVNDSQRLDTDSPIVQAGKDMIRRKLVGDIENLVLAARSSILCGNPGDAISILDQALKLMEMP